MIRVFLVSCCLLLVPAPSFASPECNLVDDAMRIASSIRELRVKRSVQCKLVDKAFVEKYIRKRIKEKIPKARISGEEIAYRLLGVIPKDYDYLEGLVELYTSQLGGYYDPDNRYYAMALWLPGHMQLPIAIHELTHALQDQHFKLDKLLAYNELDSDALLARAAVVEGDASAVMLDYTRQVMGQGPISKDRDISSDIAQTASAAVPADDVPKILTQLMLFPYVEGLRFSHALLRRGGYSELTKAFRAMPRSTEEILHPEKYGTRKREFIVIPENRPRNDSDATLVFGDTLGEFFIRILLGLWLEPETAQVAAAGWGGDRLSVYQSSSRGRYRYRLMWLTAWDSARDAAEFAAALGKAYGQRFNQTGQGDDESRRFPNTEFGTLGIHRDGAQVTLNINNE